MASGSPFVISQRDASALVRHRGKMEKDEPDDKHCFLLQISFSPVYSDIEIPNFCYKNIPRLVNGIPLGAGLMSRDVNYGIKWKYIEGSKKVLTFLSEPMFRDEAVQSKRALKERLKKQPQDIFGDITVKATVILSQAINYEDSFILNDIAVCLDDGLHFRN